MVSRPTIADLAKAAGVSVATVDRVINGRHRVREETSRRVYDAASDIGFLGLSPAERTGDGLRQYRLGFLLPRPSNAFFQTIAQGIEGATQVVPNAQIVPDIEFIDDEGPAPIVEALRASAERNQAIALAAPDYPALAVAVSELKTRNIPVFSILSDLAPGAREGYVGLSNRKAGRTAAWMIARTTRKPGKVAIFVGSHRLQGHELREVGFRSYFRENAPEFELLDTIMEREARQANYEATVALLRDHPDLVGLYVSGAAVEGTIAAVRDAGRAEDLGVVVTELTPETRAALADGVVLMALATPIASLCRELLGLMVGSVERGAPGAPGQTFIPFEMYVQENV